MKAIFRPPFPGPVFSLINFPGVDHLGWSCENRNGSERGRKETKDSENMVSRNRILSAGAFIHV